VTFETITYAEEGPVGVITLNRPHDGNMFTAATCHELRDCIEAARRETRTRVLVLTGAGDRFFCIGGRKEGMEDTTLYAGTLPTLEMYEAIEKCQKPVIASVNGFAVGGGNVLQMVCHVTIAKESAVFRQVGPMMGSFDAGYGTWYLEDLVGKKRAKEIWFHNPKIPARDAMAMGLINKVVPDAELRAATMAWANEIAERGAFALASVKAAFHARSGGVAGLSRMAHDLLLRSYLESEESQELREAFAAKRAPFLTLHHPAASRLYGAAGLWRAETLYDRLRAMAAQRPGAAALRDGARNLSLRDLLAWVDGAAAAMRALGLARGDRVSLWMPNTAEAVVAFLACSREGYACNPSLHRTHTGDEVAGLLGELEARLLVAEPGWGADRVADPVARFGGLPGMRAVWTRASFPGPAAAASPDAPEGDADGVSYLAFTSGTTGAPKCVMHSDNTLLANARDMVRDWGHGPDTVLLTLSPVSHHIAWVAVAQWLVAGCALALDDPPPGRSRLDWLRETGATYVMGVPTHAMDIQAEARARGGLSLGAVRTFYMAGAPIPPAVAEAFVAAGVTPQNVYGMTENSSHQYTHPDDPAEVIVATCGRGGRAYEVAVFDPADRDRPLPAGEVGEIGGRGELSPEPVRFRAAEDAA